MSRRNKTMILSIVLLVIAVDAVLSNIPGPIPTNDAVTPYTGNHCNVLGLRNSWCPVTTQ
ncbi:MAG: hypothetical protein ABSE82_08330 [Nitrososphaerales archaeon]